MIGADAMLTAGEDAAAAERLFKNGVRTAAFEAKHALRTLFYDVTLSRLEHPADDPLFYAALVAFERRAGLAVDGKFTLEEFGRLMKAARIASEQTFSLPSKAVMADDTFATAEEPG